MNIYGNTSGNIMNSGIALECDAGVFYIGEDFHIYRKYNNIKEKFLEVKARYLNYREGYLYFTDEKFQICRIHINNQSTFEVLVKQICYCVNIMDEYIYFRNASDNKKLYRVDLNGTNLTVVFSGSALFLNAYKNKLYFCDAETYHLYKIDANGTNLTCLSDHKVYYPNIVHDGIIYSDKSLGGKVYKMDFEGRNIINIFNSYEAYYLNVYENEIYFRNYNDNMSLWCFNMLSNSFSRVYSEDVFQINVTRDMLFFCEKIKGGQVKCLERRT